MQDLDIIFCSELNRLGIKNSLVANGCYKLNINEKTVTINLDNLRKDYAQTKNIDTIIEFIETISLQVFPPYIPSWEEIKPYICFSLESSDLLINLEDNVFFRHVTENLVKVYAYTSSNGRAIGWINNSMVNQWNIDTIHILQCAEDNMDAIILNAQLEVEIVSGVKIGMIAVEESFLKASLILSSRFYQLVTPMIGWPVYVLAPCRDIVYILSEKDCSFLDQLGNAVINQHHNSSYPLTKDVLMVSDTGLKIIGTYS